MLRTSYGSLPKIEECEDENPDEVDEMPVKPGNFYHLVITACSFVEAIFDSSCDYNEIYDASTHMQAVETRDHKKD